jgi:hypothetical protein
VPLRHWNSVAFLCQRMSVVANRGPGRRILARNYLVRRNTSGTITHVLNFHGVSTDGAYTKGTVEIVNGKMVWKEKVIGSPYLSLVKLTFTLLPDGNMKSSSEYFKGDKSVPGGHDFHYRVAPDAKLIFASD